MNAMADRVRPLLDFIAEHESETTARKLGISAYNVVWGGIAKRDRPPKPLVEMTVADVLAWQDRIDAKYRSEAAGRYQVLEDTLRGIVSEAGVKLTDLYDAKTQDAIAVALMRRRGLVAYMAGNMSAEEFANNLAKEWASLPVVSGLKAGRSYYAGDGLNKSLVDVRPFLAAVRAIREAPRPDMAQVPEQPAKEPAKGSPIGLIVAVVGGVFWAIAAIFSGIFGGG